jgi:hypothetical protein
MEKTFENKISLRQLLDDADMVLIGIGEEFDDERLFKDNEKYVEIKTELQQKGDLWLIPEAEVLFRKEYGSKVKPVMEKFAKLIADKNYFVVSTSMNPDISGTEWKENRFVAPCGGSTHKQCCSCCTEGLIETDVSDIAVMAEYLSQPDRIKMQPLNIGKCSKCGGRLILNNVYADKYDENGYLKKWEAYKKWLQGTLNRKLLVLELGVGMKYPTVIRFPFEKVAFYNNKASFVRVNERLYQMTEELSGKGRTIAENSIDWLETMC